MLNCDEIQYARRAACIRIPSSLADWSNVWSVPRLSAGDIKRFKSAVQHVRSHVSHVLMSPIARQLCPRRLTTTVRSHHSFPVMAKRDYAVSCASSSYGRI